MSKPEKKIGGPVASPIERLLSRLDGTRQTAAFQYVAKCPAHDDKSPSLAIRDLGDRLLIHCFAGCEPGEVLSAVGLTLADLFVQRENSKHRLWRPTPRHQRWNHRALLRTLRSEAAIILIAANDIAEGCPLKTNDYERLRLAIGRIVRVVEVAE